MKLKVNTRYKPAKLSIFKIVKTAGSQCIPIVNEIMNSENDPKEIVKSFIDFANMAIGLVDEKQQPSVQQQLERLLPSTRGGARGC